MSNHAHHRPKRRQPRPSRPALDVAVRTSAVLLGCTCEELELGHPRHETDSTRIHVGHDDGCPAGDAGTVRAAIITGHAA